MARSRNPEHRDALLRAATRTFAADGLGASTASIARAAGVSTGTLFVYFDTKATLINELYVVLKGEMGRVATNGLQTDASPRDQLQHMWRNWETWALEAPEKRRALAQLTVAEDLTPESRAAVHAAYVDIAALLDRIMAGGPLEGSPMSFVTMLLSAIADATLDDLIASPPTPGTEDHRSSLAFDALWRAIAGTDSTTLEHA